MMILPSKLVSERITVTFWVADEMDPLETITSHEVTINVVVGEDPNPEDLLYQQGDHTQGQYVTQQIQAGLPGVIYLLECTAVTSNGKTISKKAHLAILPDSGLIPALFGEYFTTKLYPLEHDAFVSNAFVQGSGKLRPMPFPLDSIANALTSASGVLRALLLTYSTQPESVSNAFNQASGTLRVLLLTYSMQPESIQNGFNITNGLLEVKLLTYTSPPESISNSFVQASGTLA